MIQEPVPSEVKELLERQQLNGIPVVLSTTSDLSLKGDLRGHWIVVTRDHLAVVADGVEPRLVNHVPIARVEKFRTHERRRLGVPPGVRRGSVGGRRCDTRTPWRPGSTCWPISWKTCDHRAR